MSCRPEVSIGISFKNPGIYLELALKSIFSQTFTDWELILIDDNSCDGSLELVRRLDDPRVRVYGDALSKPLSVRLNEAIELARGRYFVRMDADDIMHPNRLDRQVRMLRESDDDTVTGSAVYAIDRESRVHGIHGYPCPGVRGFAVRHAFQHPTIGAATSWFAKHRYNPEFRRSEDAELYCRTAGASTFVVASEAWVYYREVGMFNLHKHLETSAAMLQLLRRHFSRPAGKYLLHVTSELARTWLYMAADVAGSAEMLYRRRLPREEAERAARGLEVVARQTLPLRRA